jgi:RimJ/RimL family protein N-acetyltransferase
MLDKLVEPLPDPRSSLYVELIDGPLLGWVNSYRHDPSHRTIWAGIDICESAFWGRGIGTEALGLWIGYLFANLDLHRIGLETWSGNERMIRCARKCGFTEEGRFRENVEYDGRRYDGVKFGLLRREWDRGPAG